MLHPNTRPFDIPFDPDPALPPNVTHACLYTSIGADITVSCPLPHPYFDLDSPDVLNILSANADNKKRKLNRGNKRNPTTGTTIPGNAIIGNILHNNMTLITFVIDPFGRLSPILCHFLFGTRPTVPLSFPPSQPHATEMYKHHYISKPDGYSATHPSQLDHPPTLPLFLPFILFPHPIHLHLSSPGTLHL
jgi:hypothetical protein